MQLVHVELSQHARGLAAWEVWTVCDHAPFTSARDAHDAPGAAAAPQGRAGAWTSREEIRVSTRRIPTRLAYIPTHASAPALSRVASG